MSDIFESPIGEPRCTDCGATIYSGPPDCPLCGAPNCCPQCCKISNLTESNRQLREELERVKKDAMVPNHENMTYKALFGIMERDLQAKLKAQQEELEKARCHEAEAGSLYDGMLLQVERMNRALAAAKDALQTCRCLEPEQREAVANALARIAECEKGTI